MKREESIFELTGIEVRELADGAPAVAGYAVVFNAWSVTMVNERGRKFRERVAPSAFDRVLAGQVDVRALWNHNDDYPLGRTGNGTLRIDKDSRGLRFELRPDPATFWGASAVAAIRRGDVTGMSFAFAVAPDGGDVWEKPGPDGVALRTLLDADLLELSPVTYPAYPATSVTVRSVPEWNESDDRAVAENEMRSRAAARKRERERMALKAT